LSKTQEYVNETYNGGDRYKGQLENGIRSGLGMYCWQDHQYYFGSWASGNMNGHGMCLASNGNFISNCPDCAVYAGVWSSILKSGKGACYDTSGNLIYRGNFSNDQPIESYPSIGDWSEYKFQSINYPNGDTYVGETKSDKREGYGVYVWINGDSWFGWWKENVRSGRGIHLYSNATLAVNECQHDDCKTIPKEIATLSQENLKINEEKAKVSENIAQKTDNTDSRTTSANSQITGVNNKNLMRDFTKKNNKVFIMLEAVDPAENSEQTIKYIEGFFPEIMKAFANLNYWKIVDNINEADFVYLATYFKTYGYNHYTNQVKIFDNKMNFLYNPIYGMGSWKKMPSHLQKANISKILA
jgi:hypothetical protein